MALTDTEVREAIVYNASQHYDIALIQRIQREVGVDDDGLFGPITVQAVADWQGNNSLTVDGKVGPDTLAALQTAWSGSAGGMGLSAADIADAIRYNRNQGYSADEIRRIQRTAGVSETGAFDEATVRAVAQWQAQNGLVVDGKVGPNTIAAMRRQSSGAGSGRVEYRIHPGIGVARVGNSPSEFYIGPEAPGHAPSGQMRDAHDFIKRQAARFRVYEFKFSSTGTLEGVREMTAANCAITWTVRLGNRKGNGAWFPPDGSGKQRNSGVADSRLVIDSGNETVTGTNQTQMLKGAFMGASVRLGDIKTDADGRLLVLGGLGVARSPTGRALQNTFNNEEWHDDTSDGTVDATIKIGDADPVEATGSWVVVAPPDYAPGLQNVTTWYDRAFHVATLLEPTLAVAKPSFTWHIWPILQRTVLLHWVSSHVRAGHAPGSGDGDFTGSALLAKLASADAANRSAREDVYDRLRLVGGGGDDMPAFLDGLDPADPTKMRGATLTPTQLEWMKQWSTGNFTADWPGSPPTRPAFSAIAVGDQPAALDEAALETCLGGPFYPGIEASYRMERTDTYTAPFRVKRAHPPGYLTQPMALPWQTDFGACDARWWPASRPVSVYRGGSSSSASWWSGSDMLADWDKLGFIREQSSGRFEETERTLP